MGRFKLPREEKKEGIKKGNYNYKKQLFQKDQNHICLKKCFPMKRLSSSTQTLRDREMRK